MVAEFEDPGSDTNSKTMDIVNQRAEKIKNLYEELLQLKSSKEKTLEGALSVELFNRTCEEVQVSSPVRLVQLLKDFVCRLAFIDFNL